jgi:hypothetical protein
MALLATHSAPVINAGPVRLQIMPTDKQSTLDPYMAQVVTYRKSGLWW